MKQKLRGEILEKRNLLTKNQVLEKSKKIHKKLFSLPEFKKQKTIMFYVSKDNEVFTHDMIKELLGKKKIIVPIADFKNKELILSKLKDFKELEPGYYNVLEPKKGRKVNVDDIDAVIVPGVVFDKKGNRIGYGEGYYDIFLKKTKALKIGLGFDFQIVDKIKVDKLDIPVNILITEKDIIKPS